VSPFADVPDAGIDGVACRFDLWPLVKRFAKDAQKWRKPCCAASIGRAASGAILYTESPMRSRGTWTVTHSKSAQWPHAVALSWSRTPVPVRTWPVRSSCLNVPKPLTCSAKTTWSSAPVWGDSGSEVVRQHTKRMEVTTTSSANVRRSISAKNTVPEPPASPSNRLRTFSSPYLRRERLNLLK